MPPAPILLLTLLLGGIAAAEDFEQVTLIDGRVLIGRYVESEGRLYLPDAKSGKARVALSVAARDIVERRPWIDPEEAARQQASIESAKLAEAEAEAVRSRAASQAVRRTIAGQDQRIRDRQRQALDRVVRELAGERAEYWRARGHDFNPDIFTAEEMDLVVADERRRAEAVAQGTPAGPAARIDPAGAHARTEGRTTAQDRAPAGEAGTDGGRAGGAGGMDPAATQAQARALFSRALELAAWAVIGLVAYLVPLAIASSRGHRHRWPITVLCLGTPLALAAFALLPSHPAHAALVGVVIPALAVVAWITALVWSVMPGQGRSRHPAAARPRPATPAVERPQSAAATAPTTTQAATPAVDDFRAD
jgi:hypothetical protein